MIFQVYRDSNGEFRWRLLARNGRIVANCGEGYKRRGKAIRSIEKIIISVATAQIEGTDS